jgi:hypothetical protein
LKKNYNKPEYLKAIFVFGFIFFTIYDIQLSNYAFLSSGRVAFLVAALILFLSNKNIKNIHSELLILIGIFVPVISVQCINSGDFTQLSRIIFLGAYSFVCGSIASRFVSKTDTGLKLYLSCVFLQALIIITAFFVMELRSFLGELINVSANYDYNYIYRSIGLTSASGAALSVIQATGFITGLIIISNEKKFNSTNIMVIIGGSVSGISSIFVGRTGILICLLALFPYVLNQTFKKKSNLIILSLLICVTLYSLTLSVQNLENTDTNFSSQWFLSWVTDAFSVRTQSIQHLLQMDIPQLSAETLIGTGFIVTENGLNASGHDSGYIQTYYSMGLFMAIAFYSLIIYVLSSKLKGLDNHFKWFLFLIVLLIEFKEPFIFKYSIMFFIVYIGQLHLNNNKYRTPL